MKCPYCNSDNFKKSGHTKTGTQRYHCKSCNKYFTAKTKVLEKIQCEKCKSFNTIRAGKSPGGKQRYECKNCHRKGTVNALIKTTGALSQQEKCIILVYHNCGVSIEQLAKYLHKSKDTISKFLRSKSRLVVKKENIKNGMGKWLKLV